MELYKRQSNYFHHFWIPRITKTFIFSDNEDGSLKDIMLIDMQIMRIANPSIDLVYLLYSSSNNDDRKEKVTQWLKIYHDTLTDDLKALGYSGTEYPFHELEKDIDHARLFGVIMGLMHCQVIKSLNLSIRLISLFNYTCIYYLTR